jgi:hypothetical protein
MKFPSIATLTGELLKTLRRWPLTILLAVVGTWFLMQTTDYSYKLYDRYDQLWRSAGTGIRSALLFYAAASVRSPAHSYPGPSPSMTIPGG